MRFRTVSFFVSALLLLTCLVPALAQGRITQSISASTARIAVPHTVPPRALLATDLGAAPADRALNSVTLRFNLSDAQNAALDALIAAQQNPSSSLYRQWLTPEQYAARFGLSDSDLARVTSWLQSQGLTVTGVARGRGFVTVSGSVAQIQGAFGVTLHTLSLDGEQHIANLTDPTLPAPLASVVSTVTGLNDFHPRPHVRPRFTSSLSGSHFIAPGDFYTIYDINPLLTNSINGSGVTIAIAGQTDISLSDVASFRSASGLSANAPTVKLYGSDPGLSSQDIDEAQLDVEWSGAVAPGASIVYVNSTDVLAGSLTNIIDNDLAPIASVSYGNCEKNFGSSYIASFNALFRQATVQGQTVVGPAGDSGATDCDYQVSTASNGLAVDFPASSPYVTGVGGSMFNEGTGSYWGTSNGTNSGSALSYIPEEVWNETSTNGELSAGGGGASAYFTKPSWQTGTGVPADSSRDVPDVTFNAAVDHDGYLFCSQGFCTSGYRNASSNLDVVGGTSVSTPAFAGIMALLEQKIQAHVGQANPTIYALANSSFYTSVFHDITTGNNASPCIAGTTDCPGGGSIGYNATAGYDLASGWGSLDVFNYVNAWNSVTPLSSGTNGTTVSATTLSGGASNVTAGASISLTAKVASAAGTGGTPTGTVQLLIDNVATGSPVTLSAGSAGFTYSTAGLTSGIHTLTAAYSGDTAFAGSKGVFTLDITSASAADFTLTPSTATATTTSGGTAPGITFTVAPVNGFVGQVSFTASTTSSTLAASYSFAPETVSLSSAASGSTVFTLIASQSNALGTNGLLKLNASSARNHPPAGSVPPWAIPGAGVTLAGLFFLAFPRRRSRWAAMALGLAFAGVLGLSGCSTSSGAVANTPVTTAAAGTYTITVTAAGTNAAGTPLSHNATVTFVVQ